MKKFRSVSAILSFLLVFNVYGSACLKFYGASGSLKAQKILTTDQVSKLTIKAPGIGGYTNVMKVLIDFRKKDKPEIHFIDMHKYRYHFDYATENLGYRKSLEEFNKQNYTGPSSGREFVLGSVIINKQKPDAQMAMLELFSGDDLDPASVKVVMDLLSSSLPTFAKVQFHPLCDKQETSVVKTLDSNRIILTRDLAANLKYLALNKGDAVGYIKFVTKADYESGKVLLGPSDIAVFDQVPNDIGLVAAVITQELQTALSHVNVKSINRGTVNIFLKDVESLRALNGKPVSLVATEEGISKPTVLAESQADELIKQFWDKRRHPLKDKPRSVIDPKLEGKLLDLSSYYKKLPTKSQHQHLIQTVGAKAANLALVKFIVKSRGLNVEVPDTFGLPFNVFQSYFKTAQPGLDASQPQRILSVEQRVTELLNSGDLLNPDKMHRIETVSPILDEVRNVMMKAKLPDNIIQALKHAIMEDQNSPIHISKIARLRLRSSTNSEDMEGFTGAGLYDSDGVNFYKKLDGGGYDQTKPRAWEKIEEDLREVMPRLFSGIYNDRAFMERELFGVLGPLHQLIKGGLAIHSAYPLKGFGGQIEEHANGVVITTDLFRSGPNSADYPKTFLNFQHYDLAVTNPPSAEDLRAVGEQPLRGYSTEERVVTTFFTDDIQERSHESWTKWPMEVSRQTSVKNGADVLIEKEGVNEALIIAHALKVINEDMATVFEADPENFPIDSELKIYGPNRTIVIKQARPFVRPNVNSITAVKMQILKRL
jgi:hypothetical protein